MIVCLIIFDFHKAYYRGVIMRLSASINFFNGEELLRQAVLNIRPHVDHLSIVYQEKSNWGESMSLDAKTVLSQLIEDNLIDDAFCYVPNYEISPTENEFKKREIGLDLARKAQASHFLLMDADEFYIPQEIENAKVIIEEKNIAYSGIRSYFYLHRSIFRSKIPDTTNICFIVKIDSDLVFHLNGSFPVDGVDPTRRITNSSGRFHFFYEFEISMQHMAFVRKSFDSELKNTSSATNQDFIAQARNALQNWHYPCVLNFPNKPMYQIIKTADIFNLSAIQYRGKVHNVTQSIPNKILLASSRLDLFAGSEINILELAKAFLSMGMTVDICACTFGAPLLDELKKLQVGLILADDLEENSQYDLVWIQHWPVYNYLVLSKKVIAQRLIFSSLAAIEPVECVPIAYGPIDCLIVNSIENKKWVDENVPEYENIVRVMTNAAPEQFFQNKPSAYRGRPRKVAVISNHVPTDLRLAIDILRTDFDIKVDIFGQGHVSSHAAPQLITPQLLEQYDAVVSIGKTVQYSLVMGIPVYCYDHYGGPGWLNSENFDEALNYNFSGRCSKIKSVQSIAQDIASGIDYPEKIFDMARDKFSLRKNLGLLLGDLFTQNFSRSNIVLSANSTVRIVTRQNLAITRHFNVAQLCSSLEKQKNENNEHIIYLDSELLSHVNRISIQEVQIESQASQIEFYNQALYQLTHSKSWRLMAPLRYCARLLRKLKSFVH